MKSNIIPALAVIALVALSGFYINSQLTSIKYHSFVVGCLEVNSMTTVVCRSLAEQHVKGR